MRLGTGQQQPRTCRRRCSSAASSGSLLGTTGGLAEPPEGVGGLSAAASMLAGQAASMLAGHSASRAGHCSCVGQEGGGAQHLRLVQAAVAAAAAAAAAGEGIRTPAPDRHWGFTCGASLLPPQPMLHQRGGLQAAAGAPGRKVRDGRALLRLEGFRSRLYGAPTPEPAIGCVPGPCAGTSARAPPKQAMPGSLRGSSGCWWISA